MSLQLPRVPRFESTESTAVPHASSFHLENRTERTAINLRQPSTESDQTHSAGPDKRTLYVVGSGAQDAQGREILTAAGVRNNAKAIFRLPMLAQGFKGRAK